MRNGILIVGSLVLSLMIFCIVFRQWQHFERLTTQEKRERVIAKGEIQSPQIFAVNRRLKQGDKIALSTLARACDLDGSDISNRLRCYDERGKQRFGFFDTGKAGKWILSWEVTSRITGRRARKKIIVLVDGRPDL